jgi:hypothetical protein
MGIYKTIFYIFRFYKKFAGIIVKWYFNYLIKNTSTKKIYWSDELQVGDEL